MNKKIIAISTSTISLGVGLALLIKQTKTNRGKKPRPLAGEVARRSRDGEGTPTLYQKYIKRALDITCATGAMLVFSPLYAGVAIAVRVKLGSPVIFSQERPGKDEKIFKIYKFRTMTDERDENGNLLSDDVRLTRFGRLLRSTSLDELPEAWNIFKGDMSVVGPRPQLVRDMVFMTKEQRKRHIVRPGLSGLAQVRGRNAITWEDKLANDLEYIQHITFAGDVKIVLKTVGKFIKREDIVREGTVSDMDYGDYLLQKEAVTKEEYDEKQTEAIELLKDQ